MKKLLIFLLIIPLIVIARPNPQKQTAEVLNDVMNTAEDALTVVQKSGSTFTVAVGGTLTLGASMDFSDTNVSDSAYTTFATLTGDTVQVDITNNSGGSFLLRVGSSDVGVIAPGHATVIGFSNSTGEVVGIKSGSGTVSNGSLFMNFIE